MTRHPHRADGADCRCSQDAVFSVHIEPHPLLLRICSCGLVIEYDPTLGQGGCCPICQQVDIDVLDLGDDTTHTHRVPTPVDGATA